MRDYIPAKGVSSIPSKGFHHKTYCNCHMTQLHHRALLLKFICPNTHSSPALGLGGGGGGKERDRPRRKREKERKKKKEERERERREPMAKAVQQTHVSKLAPV